MCMAAQVALRSTALLLAVTLTAGCGGPKSSRRLHPEVNAPAEAWAGVGRIAVLPPDNWTMDFGPEYIAWYRAVIHELLREKGFDVVPLVDVNRFFRQNKFTIAAEATSYPIGELAARLKADAILFWTITSEGPHLAFALQKADGTALWCTGEVRLDLGYVTPIGTRYAADDGGMALALGEILRHLPGRVR